MALNRVVMVLACLTLSAAVAPAVTLDAALTTTAPSDESCNPGPPSSNFLTTDPAVYLYVATSDGASGDVLRLDWFLPDGTGYYSTESDPLPEPGAYCFDDGILVAGQPAANYPGKWTIRGSWNSASLFTLSFTLSAGGGSTLTVDSKSNIFAAGRPTAFDGSLPPFIRLTVGSGTAISFSSITGSWTCTSGGAMVSAEGGNICGGATDINSYQGISGIVDGHRSMFLVGVFLGDRAPSDPAPERLDFTDSENYTLLSPFLGQTFFIGDGLTGTGTGTPQQVVVPNGATRLFLGVEDGYDFRGNPGDVPTLQIDAAKLARP